MMVKARGLRRATIIGTGSCVPDKVYTNTYLESLVDTNAEWIETNLGIKERRIAQEGQSTSDLASVAGARAIQNAGLSEKDIDLIIVATATPDRLSPSTACIVQDKLRAYQAAAFDLGAVCSGFLFGMSVACQYIITGTYDNVLVIGADVFSRITNWKSRDCVFFGDGAGAAVLSTANEGGFIDFRLYSDGRKKDVFTVPAGGSELPASHDTVEKGLHYFQMDGRKVYEIATMVIPEAVQKILEDEDLKPEDIDWVVPHQPSIKVLEKTGEKLGLSMDKICMNMDKFANTAGGTIPILLDELNRSGKLHKGHIILFAAAGSGFTWGAALMEWTRR